MAEPVRNVFLNQRLIPGDEILNRFPPRPIAQHPIRIAMRNPSKGRMRLTMPTENPAIHPQMAFPVLRAAITSMAATSTQVNVKVCDIKFIPMKIYQGETHRKNVVSLVTRPEYNPRKTL